MAAAQGSFDFFYESRRTHDSRLVRLKPTEQTGIPCAPVQRREVHTLKVFDGTSVHTHWPLSSQPCRTFNQDATHDCTRGNPTAAGALKKQVGTRAHKSTPNQKTPLQIIARTHTHTKRIQHLILLVWQIVSRYVVVLAGDV